MEILNTFHGSSIPVIDDIKYLCIKSKRMRQLNIFKINNAWYTDRCLGRFDSRFESLVSLEMNPPFLVKLTRSQKLRVTH